ncbi:hypothetical protein ACFLSS_00625 [Bacteroidota bacterium]
MKKIIFLTVFCVTVLILTGCYTQLATSNRDTDYSESPMIIIVPPPTPPDFPPPPPPPSYDSPAPKEKMRNPEPPPSTNDNARDRIRNTGGRNNQGNRNKR